MFIEGCDLFFLTIQCIIFLGLLGSLEHPRFNIRNLTKQIQHLKKILEQMQELSKGTPEPSEELILYPASMEI